VDATYASTAAGIAVDPVDAAFLRFVVEVGREYGSISLFGRTVEKGDADEAGPEFVPLPRDVMLERLPYYRTLADVGAVSRSMGGTVRAFWRGLEGMDVVWIFGPHPLALLLAVLARIRRTRLVLGVRQDTVEYFRGRATTRRQRLLFVPAGRILDLSFRVLARKHPVTVVGPQIARRYGAPRPGVHEMVVSLVRAGDVAAEPPAQPPVCHEPLRLLTVGRIEPEKTPLVLVEALAELERRAPGRYRLRWVGHGKLAREVRTKAEALGIGSLIEMPGFVAYGPELLRLYREADVFVHVAATEGVPQVLLEAMAAGTPIVATDVGGVRSLIGANEVGLLVPPRDPPALVDAILRLDDVTLRSRLVTAGIERVKQLTVEAQAGGLVAFLESPA
jgi:glycosyltransferase involved in cell wall biosynthesis